MCIQTWPVLPGQGQLWATSVRGSHFSVSAQKSISFRLKSAVCQEMRKWHTSQHLGAHLISIRPLFVLDEILVPQSQFRGARATGQCILKQSPHKRQAPECSSKFLHLVSWSLKIPGDFTDAYVWVSMRKYTHKPVLFDLYFSCQEF